MEGESGGCSQSSLVQPVAPFVAKTYQMVCDPRTDELIRWGKGNNSFLVLDPADFSLLLLPAYFKHNNFSSFIRQLNTYGFRKVDPDKWEFAHESFLRGQTHLLPLVLRRKKRAEVDGGCGELIKGAVDMELEDEDVLVKELGRLRAEQRVIEGEILGMAKRLKDTERRPNQMMSFLSKLVDDPDLLVQKLTEAKKRRLIAQHQPQAAPPAQPLQISSPPADSTVFYPLNTSGGFLGLNQGYAFPAISLDRACANTVYGGGIDSTVSGTQTVDHQVLLGGHVLCFTELELAAAVAATSSASLSHGFLSSLG